MVIYLLHFGKLRLLALNYGHLTIYGFIGPV
jgi:hypothetical protein